MQTEKSMVSLQEEAASHAHPAPQPTSQQPRTPYKVLFFVTFSLLLLSCGYILGNATANKAAPVPNSQAANEAKEASAKTRSVAQVPAEQSPKPKAVSETIVQTKTEKAEATPVVPAPVASPEAVVSPAASATPAVQANTTTGLTEVGKDENKTKLYNFPLTENSNITIVFLTCCHRHDMLQEVLLGFIELNEYPFKKLIVVSDGPSDAEVNAIAVKFPNLTLLSTGDKGGQLRAIDEALKLVDTAYVYYSEDDFKLVHTGLITLNIQELEKDPKLLQMWNGWHSKPRYVAGTNIVDNRWQWGGFSFQPAVWRMSDYLLIKGGFAKYTKDLSRGIGAGQMEQRIVEEYKRQGFFVRKTAIDYVQHLGVNRGLPRKTRR